MGCSGPDGPTKGFVYFDDGEPVQSGSVELRNKKDKRRYGGRIISNGSFQPADKRGTVGVPPGEYEAVVVQIVLTEDLALQDHDHGKTVEQRFADYYTSGLRVNVKAGQTDPIKIIVTASEPRSHGSM